VRVNFNYFVSDAVVDYIIEAVRMVARDGWRLLGDYHFDTARGIWRHRRGLPDPPLKLADVSYDDEGRMGYPRHHASAGEDALAGYLDEAKRIMAEADPPDLSWALSGLVSDDFEHLRWFDLPAGCLAD
jgi:hypothetical protein